MSEKIKANAYAHLYKKSQLKETVAMKVFHHTRRTNDELTGGCGKSEITLC